MDSECDLDRSTARAQKFKGIEGKGLLAISSLITSEFDENHHNMFFIYQLGCIENIDLVQCKFMELTYFSVNKLARKGIQPIRIFPQHHEPQTGSITYI